MTRHRDGSLRNDTGVASHVTLHPAAPGTGIVFRLPSDVPIPATADYVVDTRRCTVLGLPTGEKISTVEHLLSACVGLGVADLTVKVDGPEILIGDGSALTWVEALREGGFPSNDVPIQRQWGLSDPLTVTGADGAFIAAFPSGALRFTVAVSFPHPLIGTQVARFEPDESGDGYGVEYDGAIAGARTFGFIEEVEALLAAGLARGGTIDNAVVVYPDRFSTPLRFDDEFARHKLLDLMGDLALCGTTILPMADIIAVKPSHRLNTEFALRLLHLLQAGHGGVMGYESVAKTHKE